MLKLSALSFGATKKLVSDIKAITPLIRKTPPELKEHLGEGLADMTGAAMTNAAGKPEGVFVGKRNHNPGYTAVHEYGHAKDFNDSPYLNLLEHLFFSPTRMLGREQTANKNALGWLAKNAPKEIADYKTFAHRNFSTYKTLAGAGQVDLSPERTRDVMKGIIRAGEPLAANPLERGISDARLFRHWLKNNAPVEHKKFKKILNIPLTNEQKTK